MIRAFLYWLTGKLPARVIDGDHGEPYLERYFLCSFLGATVYIHRFVASDPDRGLHDHPWGRSLSLVLVGGYREVRRSGAKAARCRTLNPWQLNYIRGTDFHRIVLDPGEEAWTLFMHGKRTKGWGFLRNGKYLAHTHDKDDYPLRQWWATAPTGRALRAKRLTDLIEEAAAIIDGEALALRQSSTTGPNFDTRLYVSAEHMRTGSKP